MGLTWWRLEMAAPAELEESLLWKLPQLGVHRVALQHKPEAPQERQLVAWLPASEWPASERDRLPEALTPLAATFGLPLPVISWSEQADEDWSLTWKQHWQPDPVGERLLILPAWLDCPSEFNARLQIRMDPGSAFGTGSHPTTRLCLEALEDLAGARDGRLGGWQVADLGCGSGVLGLAALRLGAAGVAAADTDSLAVTATRDNAALNGLSSQLAVVQGSAAELAALLTQGPADLLLCNILAPVIEALSPSFVTLLAPGGVGLLSGLLVDQAARLQQVLAALGWQAELKAQQAPWGLLLLHKSR
ncbi:MAG: 50S ribosomal protein L11 methyltransferase [Cyanobacteria bacterium K_DeepCast_35m_m2_023]|nr:50S ribosomal protein L11 methyltransferase [Cyanobacteria bacterium K_DeepCast_35m_m2_023]